MQRTFASLALIVAAPLWAQTATVTYRDRAKADRPIKSVKGKIDSESPASVKVGNIAVPVGDIVDVNYETPDAIRLEYPKALNAEKRDAGQAIKEYEALLPKVNAVKPVRRAFEYRIVLLKIQQTDDSPKGIGQAIDVLTKFRKDHADGWQVVPATRLQARLLQDKTPANYDAARKLFEELAALPVGPEVKAECQYQIIDLLLAAKKNEEAKSKVGALPTSDPRVPLYEAALSGDAKKLEALVEKVTDTGVKAAGYNLLGDMYRRDGKKLKDALYSYLWVDVVYNQDPQESAKAIDRLADLFRDLKDDARAKQYRDRQRMQ